MRTRELALAAIVGLLGSLVAPRVVRADDPQPTPHPVPVDEPKRPRGEPVQAPHGDPVQAPHGEPVQAPHGEPVDPNGQFKPPEPKPDVKPDPTKDPKNAGKQPPGTNPAGRPPTGPGAGPGPGPNGPPSGPPGAPGAGPGAQPPGPGAPPPLPPGAKPLPPTEPVKPEPPLVVGQRDAHLNGNEKISEIIVTDNTKTTSDTVALIARIEVGDDFTADMSERIKHDLVSSGLFKSAEVYYDKVAGHDNEVRVHLIVKDKWSWVVAPAFYNQPTNTGGGLGYGENNLFGLNQKLLVYAQIATGDSFFVGAWQIPSIYGTRWNAQVDTYFASSRNIEYAPSHRWLLADDPAVRESRLLYLNAGLRLGFQLWHALYLNGRIRGAHVSYSDVHLSEGATMNQVTNDPMAMAVPKPGKEGWDISNEFDLSIDRRANWYGVQTGTRFGLGYEQSLGGDFTYKEATFGLFKGWQILERHNLVFKANLKIGQDMPFQQEFLMGGTSMRGWVNNQFRGDLNALVNVEYSLPLFTIFGLGVRGLGFFDSGYTTWQNLDANGIPTNPERNYLNIPVEHGLSPFKNSIGVGTRLVLRQIVIPLLGLDVGYGLEARDVQVYLAIGLTD